MNQDPGGASWLPSWLGAHFPILQTAPRRALNEHQLCACPASHLDGATLPQSCLWPPLYPSPRGLPANAKPAVSCPILKPITGCRVHMPLTWPAWSLTTLLVPEPRSSPLCLLRPPRSACTWALPELPEAGFLWAKLTLDHADEGPRGDSRPVGTQRAEGTSTWWLWWRRLRAHPPPALVQGPGCAQTLVRGRVAGPKSSSISSLPDQVTWAPSWWNIKRKCTSRRTAATPGGR